MELAIVESEVEFAGRVEEHDFVVGVQQQVNVFPCTPTKLVREGV